ncbi:MAG TPA: C4-dicarboxylate ABC transporter substrate-binding protein [Deltaproteobacteria bacterium]|nr:C4-dicarboxylate ABC transporter substrate-binding protein [Deltaproteobacteria bacterium]
MRKLTILSIVALSIFAFSVSFGDAKTIIKYGHVGPPIHGQHKGALAFATYVADKTNGEIEVQVFPLGQLGGERSMAEQVQAGTLHMTAVTTAVLSNFVPQLAVFDLPFIYPNRETAYKALADKDVQKKFFPLCDAKGFVAIGYTENEFRDVTNSKRPIRKPEDMRDLKIRTIESPVYLDTFRTYGANPVPLPFPEIYNALQQRVIDGQDNPLFTSVLMKFIEVNKYATMTHHILTECYTIVNKKVWDGLTSRQREIFIEAAEVQIKVNRESNAQDFAGAIEKAKKQGVRVVELSPAEREAFKQASKPVYDKYRKIIGPEYYDFYMKKIASYGKKR